MISMSLFKKIDEDMIKALKGGDKERLTVLRGLKSDIKYKQIEKKSELTDDEVIAVLNSCIKKRRDSIEMFKLGKRDDLVSQEEFGLKVIQQYVPEELSPEELTQIIRKAIEETGADSPAKVGLVMKAVMPYTKGRADGKLVNKIVLELLSR